MLQQHMMLQIVQVVMQMIDWGKSTEAIEPHSQRPEKKKW
jgi:hypothetical protein